MSRRPAPLLVLLLIVALAAALACSGGSSLGDRLLITRDGQIFELDLRGGERLLFPRPEGAVLTDVAVSPDGAQVAFTRRLTPVVLPDEPTDFGADILLGRRDGSEARVLLPHGRRNELIITPAWLPDGSALLVSVQDQSQARVQVRLERFDLATGRRTFVADGGFRAAVAPDGARIAYVKIEQDYSQTLWLADIDGSNAVQVAGGADGLGTFSSPRFSPDGGALVFGAAPSGTPQVRAAAGGVEPGPAEHRLLGRRRAAVRLRGRGPLRRRPGERRVTPRRGGHLPRRAGLAAGLARALERAR